MRQFYTALLAGRTKAQALRDASLYLRKQPATAHPAYWAPFQLIGNWGK
jgi:CHAT domain-containing protein